MKVRFIQEQVQPREDGFYWVDAGYGPTIMYYDEGHWQQAGSDEDFRDGTRQMKVLSPKLVPPI
jgi:hypothetical protein